MKPHTITTLLLAVFVPGAGYVAVGKATRGVALTVLLVALMLLGALIADAGHVLPVFALLALSALLLVASIVDIMTLRPHAVAQPTWVILIAVIGFITFAQTAASATRAYLIEAFRIPSGSMIPTLQVGDHLYVDKRARTPQRGDVVVFRSPKNPGIDFIKRVVAVGGEQVEVRDHAIFVNGVEVQRHAVAGDCTFRDYDEDTSTWSTNPCEAFDEGSAPSYRIIQLPNAPAHHVPATRVPDDAYWVVGDNRDNSFDSRHFGPVPKENIKGTARVLWWANDHTRIGERVR